MQTKHFGQLVALSALWGASFMLIRVASPVMGPTVLALLRVGAATVTLGILMRVVQHRWPVGHWRELALLGALSVACPFLLFAWAALQLPAGYSALLNSTAVIFGIFASAWLKEDTLTVRKPDQSADKHAVDERPDWLRDEWTYLRQVVRGQCPVDPLSSLENNVIVARILDAARESARTGQAVRISEH